MHILCEAYFSGGKTIYAPLNSFTPLACTLGNCFRFLVDCFIYLNSLQDQRALCKRRGYINLKLSQKETKEKETWQQYKKKPKKCGKTPKSPERNKVGPQFRNSFLYEWDISLRNFLLVLYHRYLAHFHIL